MAMYVWVRAATGPKTVHSTFSKGVLHVYCVMAWTLHVCAQNYKHQLPLYQGSHLQGLGTESAALDHTAPVGWGQSPPNG